MILVLWQGVDSDQSFYFCATLFYRSAIPHFPSLLRINVSQVLQSCFPACHGSGHNQASLALILLLWVRSGVLRRLLLEIFFLKQMVDKLYLMILTKIKQFV